MVTHFGSHVLKSKEGQPPAPGTLVTVPDVLLECPPDGACVVPVNDVVQIHKQVDKKAFLMWIIF
jgi:hypothetical protein